MHDAAIDRMRRDVVLAGDVESAGGVGHDLLMHVAVGAADVDVRARVVGDEAGVLAAPGAGEIFGRLETRRIAGADHQGGQDDKGRAEHCGSHGSYQSTPAGGAYVTMILPLLLALAQQQPLDGFDAYVSQAMKDWRVPGLAIVVVKDDSVTFIKGYGVRELGKPDPVTVHTRFGNMSTTKAFTSMLVAMLADSGKLSFDDPVWKYEPNAVFMDPYVSREVTIRDLLTHRVGFPDPYYLWDATGYTFDQMVQRLRLVQPASS